STSLRGPSRRSAASRARPAAPRGLQQARRTTPPRPPFDASSCTLLQKEVGSLFQNFPEKTPDPFSVQQVFRARQPPAFLVGMPRRRDCFGIHPRSDLLDRRRRSEKRQRIVQFELRAVRLLDRRCDFYPDADGTQPIAVGDDDEHAATELTAKL